ncbi:MAG: polysaccharide biosynthesis/export family protein [Myxococcales bacterium]|nr:polysaccharide biosynthesis/export family protein [Myxococcales bacterium]
MRWLVVLVLAAACGSNLPKYNYAAEPDPRTSEVVLGVGDVVAINVWGEGNKDLNTEATIRPDGTITMPLVGDLKAAGQTPTELKGQIKAKLGDFVKTLQGSEITVALKTWRSYRFTIQGEVVKTGVFTTDQFVTIADALALAGGPTRFARRDGIVLMRTDAKTKQVRRIPFDYDLLASGKRVDMNIYVLPGDTIYVP